MGALRTKKFTQLKTQYMEPGAEHSLFIHKTDDGQDAWVPCGTWTNRADAIKALEAVQMADGPLVTCHPAINVQGKTFLVLPGKKHIKVEVKKAW